jgi:hypothetical protein
MMKAQKLPLNSLLVASTEETFRVQDEFYPHAEILRLQLEESMSDREQTGITPLTFVYSENRYRFLTANATNIFGSDLVQQFVEHLDAWGQRELDTSHASTPQVRVYVAGCERGVVADAVMLGWHYMLSLTQRAYSRRDTRVRIVAPDRTQRRNGLMSACHLVDAELTFNRLIVHDTQSAYGIEVSATSMNPVESAIFLDGYLW